MSKWLNASFLEARFLEASFPEVRVAWLGGMSILWSPAT